MNSPIENAGRPTFYTVREAARIMRCNPSTLYRAIREDAFPAVRLRTRYVVPAAAVEQLATEAADPAVASTSPDGRRAPHRP